MIKFKLVRWMYAVMFCVIIAFAYPVVFTKTLIGIHIETPLNFEDVMEYVKYAVLLYKAHMRAVFEWANDGNIEKYRKNMVIYMEEVKP